MDFYKVENKIPCECHKYIYSGHEKKNQNLFYGINIWEGVFVDVEVYGNMFFLFQF